MEVFIAYRPHDNFQLLADTANAWGECFQAEPVMIQVDDRMHKAEMVRRIVADNMSKGGFYLLADLGCVPDPDNFVSQVTRRLSIGSYDLVGFHPSEGVPTGVRLCRKGAVKHWVPKRTAGYDQEHVESVTSSGGRVEIWEDIAYRRVLEC